MTKRKSKATVMVPDGSGGMILIQDQRFQQGDWPIRFDVPREQAGTWLPYLYAECTKRAWGCSNFSQLDAKENSGNISIQLNGGQGVLAVLWERERDGPIKIRARSEGTPEVPLSKADELFKLVNEQCLAGVKERFCLHGYLQYSGLPWRGEFWIEDSLRLGPPSKQDEKVLIGTPRIILIDAQVDGIDQLDAYSSFEIILRELSVFLSIVMRMRLHIPISGARGWTWTAKPSGEIECDLQNLGYVEKNFPTEMPVRDKASPVPLLDLSRPDFSIPSISIADREQWLPNDTADLWQLFKQLPQNKRQQFLQVGTLWQLALSIKQGYQTASFALMVAACEALKPSEKNFRDHNVYHVIEALLGKTTVDLLKEEWFKPQDVRNVHFHAGEFRGSEFVQYAMMASYSDPSFDQGLRELVKITPAAIIEWLKRGGNFTMPPLKSRRRRRR